MKAIDFSAIYKKFKGRWVTLDDNYKVISSNHNLKKAYDEAVKKGYKEPGLFRVPEENLPFIG